MSGPTHRITTTTVLIALQVLINEPGDIGIVQHPGTGHFFLAPFVLVAGWIGTALPDLDIRYLQTHRWLGRVLPHRGPSHSLLLSLIGGGVTFWAFSLLGLPSIGLAILVGWLAHILADALTIPGVALLWPRRRRMRLLPRRLCIRPAQESIVQRLAVVVIMTLIGLAIFRLTT